MINKDRIVPVTATDLISMYGLIVKAMLNAADDGTVEPINAVDSEGNFELSEAFEENTVGIASEPVSSFDFGSEVSTAAVYFVPSYDYTGFTVNGVPATLAEGSAEVVADGSTLYMAGLANGTVTIMQMGF